MAEVFYDHDGAPLEPGAMYTLYSHGDIVDGTPEAAAIGFAAGRHVRLGGVAAQYVQPVEPAGLMFLVESRETPAFRVTVADGISPGAIRRLRAPSLVPQALKTIVNGVPCGPGSRLSRGLLRELTGVTRALTRHGVTQCNVTFGERRIMVEFPTLTPSAVAQWDPEALLEFDRRVDGDGLCRVFDDIGRLTPADVS